MLNETQLTTLATHIRASVDPAVVSALAVRNDTELARLYNLESTFIVWREAIQPSEYREQMVWTEVDGLQAGKARIWEWITQNMTMDIDATKDNVRAGLAEVFPSNQTTRGQLLAIAKEPANLYESIFATGTGTDASPGVRAVAGNVSHTIIGKALNDNP